MTSFWKNKRILVTGGAGFIGSHLVERLLTTGVAKLRAADNLERGRLEFLGDSLKHPALDFCKVDLRDRSAAYNVSREIDVVFHLASKVGGIGYYQLKPGEVFADNVQIDHNVWSAALDLHIPYFLYASSAHVYPLELQTSPDAPPIIESQAYPANPELSYGWAKLIGEKLLLYSHQQGCTTRVAIPRIVGSYGPHQSYDLATGSAIPVFCRRAIEYPQRSPFTIWGTGTETRSFHYISDTLDAFLLAVQKLEQQQVVGPFNLGAAGRVTIGDIARTIIDISRKPIEIQWDTSRSTLIWGQALNCDLAAALLDGWRPRVTLREGLELCYRDIETRLANEV